MRDGLPASRLQSSSLLSRLRIPHAPTWGACLRSVSEGRPGKEVYEVAIRIAEQGGPVAPGHGGRFEHDVLEHVLQSSELRIDVGDEVLDDDRVVATGLWCVVAEHRDGCCVCDREGSRGRSELGEDWCGPCGDCSRDGLVEAGEPVDVVSDDADRCEVHSLPFSRAVRLDVSILGWPRDNVLSVFKVI